MQTSQDPRHLKRIEHMQVLFQWDFRHHAVGDLYVRQIIKKIKEIDDIIQKEATMWKIEDMARVDVAILRLAVYELTEEKDVPAKTAIDEAVELAKEFGNEKSPPFINGVLDKIYADKLQKQETA